MTLPPTASNSTCYKVYKTYSLPVYCAGVSVRSSKYNLRAPKQTVSLTLNSDLYAQAKALDINDSKIAEEALANAVDRRKAEKLMAEIRSDIVRRRGRSVVQFDVFENPIPCARLDFPRVIVLQSDVASVGRDRIVAPLVPRKRMAKLAIDFLFLGV
jgi:post-segregation antitoxin (ccd killing protein)